MKKNEGKRAILASVSVALLMVSSCGKDHGPVTYTNPIDSGDVSRPPVPRDLVAHVGDQTVHLTWEISDTADVMWYRVARKDSLEGNLVVIDSVAQRSYVNRGLKNGRIYWYRVCVMSKKGFVGSYSNEVTAAPNGFTMSINGGNKFTTSVSVTLKISAPGGASFMMLANDSLFTDASWEPFMEQKNWFLSSGDGEKWVYLKIRDLDDNETSGFHEDSILLDTRASINTLTFSPVDSVFSPGDHIHFFMETGEAQGQAEIDIGTAETGKKLFDDGTHGDQVIDDGTYELTFVIPSGLQVVEAPVRGRFTDEAGNVAEEMTSVRSLTIQKAPEAVQFFAPSSVETSETALHLTWSQNQDEDFVAYRIYRSEISGVDTAPDRKLVEEITNQSTTSYDDTELEENHTYYYKIYVYDEYGLFSGSNEVSGITGENQAPQAVTLFPPVPIGSSSSALNLSWTPSQEADFAAYKLYRSLSPGVESSPDRILVTTIIDQQTVFYDDEGLEANTPYYYLLFIFDTGGLSAASNEVSGTTNTNEAPEPATLVITSVQLTPGDSSTAQIELKWTRNQEVDFDHYIVYRDLFSPVSTSSAPIDLINDNQTTTIIDSRLFLSTQYFYRVYVCDQGGLCAGSNEVEATTPSGP